jgi:hypothetical protein
VNSFRYLLVCNSSRVPLDVWYYQGTFRTVLLSEVLSVAIGKYEFVYIFIIIIIIPGSTQPREYNWVATWKKK